MAVLLREAYRVQVRVVKGPSLTENNLSSTLSYGYTTTPLCGRDTFVLSGRLLFWLAGLLG